VTNGNTDRAQVLRFWRAVELFSPQDVPKVNARKNVYRVTGDGPLPWEHGHPLRRTGLPESVTWRHTVYGGIFSLRRVRAALEKAFGSDGESFDARPLGDSALFAFTVTDEGRPLLGSEEFASCAWATGRLLQPGPGDPGWLDGFENASAGCGLDFTGLVAALETDARAAELRALGHEVGRPVGGDTLAELIAEVTERFGVASALAPAEIRVASIWVSRKREFAADSGEFLNSFFAPDLASVADTVAKGDYGVALGGYLRGPGYARQRIDLRERPGVVDDQVRPEHTPAGRWPAGTNRPLALSQQFAVNTALRELDDTSGIFAVNGPPGTGKTTMLREQVAAIVVQRACHLAALARPQDAFTREFRWKTGDHTRTVSGWSDQLTGFEIVVASSNNGAVENISLEIPGQDAIDGDEWRPEASYYADLATFVLNNDAPESDAKAWGLIAARLGKKSNRQKFAMDFWFGERSAATKGPAAKRSEAKGPRTKGFQDILKGYASDPDDWRAAVDAFRAALREVDRLREERTAAARKLSRIPAVQADIEEAEAQLTGAAGRLAQIRNDLTLAKQNVASAEQQATRSAQARQSHRSARPGLLDVLLSLGRSVREWRIRDRELASAQAEADQKLTAARTHAEMLQLTWQAAQRTVSRHRMELLDLSAWLERLNSDVADAVARWGDAVPTRYQRADATRRELAGPWTDPEWNAARSRLFLEALRLHQAFLAAEPTRMRKSLHGAMDVLNGNVPPGTPEAAVRAAWRSLFFVVPVISTTFASFARVFSHLGRESLGWLFIDEAGQAAPQAAAGAIWRSRRVMAVGDPLQIEPVVSLPFTAQQALRDHYGVAEWWLPSRTSAQRLADEANTYGTYLHAGDGQVWVGAPLRAHRRCTDPMFTISNTIAYGGLMVYGTVSRDEPIAAPDSRWIHVPATESDGHWIPAEGQQARKFLTELGHLYGVEPGQIFVLSPFREVADRIQQLCREFTGLRGGTVHTAQGKEADVVLLILGGDPRKPGARQWASERPNLLNVAVSRARQRLYVIGDRTAWSRHRHFDELARHLPE
jgi:hypothetical protein